MKNYTFYTNPQSRGAVISWMLAECDLVEGKDYETVIVQYESTESPNGIKSPEYLAVNPMGKVPALRVHDTDGDVIITEGSAICAYLADAHPEKALAPPVNSPLRGSYYRWLFYTHAVLEAAVMDKALGLAVPENMTSTAGYGNFELVMDTLANTLADTTYLCGDQFTAADLYLSNALHFYMQFNLMPKRDAFEAYVNRHLDRAAYQQSQPN